MGDYLECPFPYLRVRYISINDGDDSKNYQGTTGGMDVVVRAIIYDAYSKDLSVKVKTGKNQGRKKGRRVGGYPGYGYKRDPGRTAMDIIDPEAAVVVRRIFDSAIDGMKIGAIARMLNDYGIPTPGVYFRQHHPDTRKFAQSSEKQSWNYDMIRAILKRYTYTGAAVNGTLEAVSPCKNSVRKKSFKDWVIVPGMHEAIVTPEEYELAQRIMRAGKSSVKGIPPHPLKSLVVCGNCLRIMEWNKHTIRRRCRYGSYGGDAGCRNLHPPKESELEAIVLRAIKNFIGFAELWEDKAMQRTASLQKDANANRRSLETTKKRMAYLKRRKLTEYECYAKGEMSQEAYLAKNAL